jgi:hypothetical protein
LARSVTSELAAPAGVMVSATGGASLAVQAATSRTSATPMRANVFMSGGGWGRIAELQSCWSCNGAERNLEVRQLGNIAIASSSARQFGTDPRQAFARLAYLRLQLGIGVLPELDKLFKIGHCFRQVACRFI